MKATDSTLQSRRRVYGYETDPGDDTGQLLREHTCANEACGVECNLLFGVREPNGLVFCSDSCQSEYHAMLAGSNSEDNLKKIGCRHGWNPVERRPMTTKELAEAERESRRKRRARGYMSAN